MEKCRDRAPWFASHRPLRVESRVRVYYPVSRVNTEESAEYEEYNIWIRAGVARMIQEVLSVVGALSTPE